MSAATDPPVDHGRTTLPWCSFVRHDDPQRIRRVGVGLDHGVVDVAAALPELADLFDDGTLDALLALDAPARSAVRTRLLEAVDAGLLDAHRTPVGEVDLLLAWTVRDYVDFYASEHHAGIVGRIFRPGTDPLPRAWKHLPIGYHGRAGSVVVSGTPVTRPRGQRREDDAVVFGPSTRLDFEAEVGFVVAGPPGCGPLSLREAEERLFGVCLVDDWSARDLQAWEYVPLGPFLGKSFATSVSPWIVPIEALEAARVAPPERDVPLQPYLDDTGAPLGGLDLRLEVRVNDVVVSRPPFASTYWTAAQMLAHLCVNGAPMRPGDLFASGTVSGPRPDQRGALIELTWDGTEPLTMPGGTTLAYLRDGDEVTISATAPGLDGTVVHLGAVAGRIHPAEDLPKPS